MQRYTKILLGMLLGAVLGLLVGPNSRLLSATGVILGKAAIVVDAPDGKVAVPQALGVTRAHLLERRGQWLHVEWELRPKDAARLASAGVEGRSGDTYRGWVGEDPVKARRYAPLGQSLVNATEWLGRLFLSMIRMVVVPLVFFSLILGIAALGDFRKLGRMGGVVLGYFTVTTVLALVIGLVLANLVAPGRLIGATERALLQGDFDASVVATRALDAPSVVDQLVAVVPTNPFSALANADMLQCIFFATMVGIALTLVDPERAAPVVELCGGLNEAMVSLVHIAMKLAPVGVAALLFQVVGTTGLAVLGALAGYGVVVLLGLALHVVLVYAPVVKVLARRPFLGFLRGIRSALVVAFSTSSSSATLPVTLRAVEDNLGVRREIASFVLPLGATVNMDGTALYQGVAAVFIAQIYGVDLTLADQATIVVSATLASVGAAGVPGAGMITLAMVLSAVGLPVEGVALIVGIDRLLDMFRTTINVVGDVVATVFLSRIEDPDPGPRR